MGCLLKDEHPFCFMGMAVNGFFNIPMKKVGKKFVYVKKY